jgi:hypothetical protein
MLFLPCFATKTKTKEKKGIGIASEKMSQGGPFPCICNFLAKTIVKKRKKNKNAMLK